MTAGEPKNKYDLVIKDLFQKDHPTLLDRLTGETPVRQVLNIELPVLLERRADLVLLLEDETIKHIEFQNGNDKDMPYREGIYALMIAQKYRRKVHQDVLYFGQEEMRMADRVDVGGVQVTYRLIDIREFDADALLASGRPGDWALAMLARGGTERLHEILSQAKKLPGAERGRLLTQLALLSGLRDVSNGLRMEMKAMGSGYIDVENNPILQDWMEEAGTRFGAKVVRQQMVSRFGPLPGWAEERLKSATSADIESWANKVLTATSIEGVLGKG